MFPVKALRGIDSDSAGSEARLPRAVAPRIADVAWVHDGPVCVTIIDGPRPGMHDAYCRCDACQARVMPERASDFI